MPRWIRYANIAIKHGVHWIACGHWATHAWGKQEVPPSGPSHTSCTPPQALHTPPAPPQALHTPPAPPLKLVTHLLHPPRPFTHLLHPPRPFTHLLHPPQTRHTPPAPPPRPFTHLLHPSSCLHSTVGGEALRNSDGIICLGMTEAICIDLSLLHRHAPCGCSNPTDCIITIMNPGQLCNPHLTHAYMEKR